MTIREVAEEYNVSPQAVRKRLKNRPLVLKHYAHNESGIMTIDEEGVRLLMSDRSKDTRRSNNRAGDNRVVNPSSVVIQEQDKMNKEINDLMRNNRHLTECLNDLTARFNDFVECLTTQADEDPPQANKDRYRDAETRLKHTRVPRYEELHEDRHKDQQMTETDSVTRSLKL
jgi:hypothetical protein